MMRNRLDDLRQDLLTEDERDMAAIEAEIDRLEAKESAAHANASYSDVEHFVRLQLSPSPSLASSESSSSLDSDSDSSKTDIANEVSIEEKPEPAASNKGHYAAARWMTYALVPSAFLGEVSCSYFFGTYTAIGATYVAQQLGFDIPDLPTSYGDPSDLQNLLMFTHPVIEVLRFSSIFGELLNGVTQFEINSAVETVDNAVYDLLHPEGGYSNVIKNTLRLNAAASASNSLLGYTFGALKKGSVATYIGLSYTFFVVASAAGSYADLEQIKEPVQKWCTEIGGNALLAYLGVGAMLYCALAFGPKTQKGIEFWLKDSTLKARYKNHNSILVEMQSAAEMVCVTVMRASTLSFSFGRLGEQWKVMPALFYGLGAVGGLFQGAQIFGPFTYNNYHERVDVAADETPISTQERKEAYARKYGPMSYAQRALTEVRRSLFIGVAQSAFFGAYVMGHKVAPILTNYLVENDCPKEVALGIQIALATLTAGLAYIPYYKAKMYKDLNEAAYEYRKVEASQADEALVLADANAIEIPNDAEEAELDEEEVRRPNMCASFWGISSSFAMVSTRLLSGVSALINNAQIGSRFSRADLTATGLYLNTIVGDNRFRTMTAGSVDTLSQFRGCGYAETVSKTGMFKNNHPDALRQRLTAAALTEVHVDRVAPGVA